MRIDNPFKRSLIARDKDAYRFRHKRAFKKSLFTGKDYYTSGDKAKCEKALKDYSAFNCMRKEKLLLSVFHELFSRKWMFLFLFPALLPLSKHQTEGRSH